MLIKIKEVDTRKKQAAGFIGVERKCAGEGCAGLSRGSEVFGRAASPEIKCSESPEK